MPNLGGDEEEAEVQGSQDEILGGPENDIVNGTNGNDLIRTFLGDDTIYAGGGNDEVRAGDGADYVEGGAGNDNIFGNEGIDRIISDRGDDYVDGGTGSDIIRGGEGNDTLLGGLNTVLDENGLPTGDLGATDQINGDDGDDLLIAWGGQSTLNGGLNGDTLTNPTNNDTLVAATGEVIMENRTGANTDIALTTLEDDQVTQATIVDFNLGLTEDDDTLVLTVDHSTDVDLPPSYVPEFMVSYASATSDAQSAGTLITVTWDNPYDTTGTQTESANAFIVSRTPTDIEGNIKIEVYLTKDAAYADPLATLESIGQLDPNAVTFDASAGGWSYRYHMQPMTCGSPCSNGFACVSERS